MSSRPKDYYRRQRFIHINRKRTIIRDVYRRVIYNYFYEHPGYLSKNKIHCSCDLCTDHCISIRDYRNLMSMKYDMIDSNVDSKYLADIERSLRKTSY